MSRLNHRVDALEQTSAGTDRLTAAIRTIYEPSPEGPVRREVCAVTIVGSAELFLRESYSSEDAFLAAASACHQRIHGQPLDLKEEATE
ncbi:MAG: hypothetical protein AAGD13_01030 [Pseudomonadota bacterium]